MSSSPVLAHWHHYISGGLTENQLSSEIYQLAMYLLDQYRGTTLSCRYDIPPRLAESQAQLENAVKVAVVEIIMRPDAAGQYDKCFFQESLLDSA